jgi:hypothetical protein
MRTMYYDLNGELVTDNKQIIVHYARTWLTLDLISSMPIDWFSEGISFKAPSQGSNSDSQAAAQLTLFLRVFRLVKLLRLLRIARLFRYFGKWEAVILSHFNSNWIRLFKQLAFLFLFSHWNGCIQ